MKLPLPVNGSWDNDPWFNWASCFYFPEIYVLFIHSFYVEHLLFDRYCSRPWETYQSTQPIKIPVLMIFIFHCKKTQIIKIYSMWEDDVLCGGRYSKKGDGSHRAKRAILWSQGRHLSKRKWKEVTAPGRQDGKCIASVMGAPLVSRYHQEASGAKRERVEESEGSWGQGR